MPLQKNGAEEGAKEYFKAVMERKEFDCLSLAVLKRLDWEDSGKEWEHAGNEDER